MKTKITVLLLLAVLTLSAQFNKTYDINNNDDLLQTPFNIATRDLGSAAVSWGQSGRLNYFTVTRHDAFGNVVYNTRIFPQSTRTEGFTHVRAMIETEDQGVLVAGYFFFDENSTRQPFLAKVDARGSFEWIKYYKVNSAGFSGYEFNKISLARVEDEEKELYFIVSTARSDIKLVNDAVVSVIKVDAKGNMVWSKKYNDATVFGPTFTELKDLAGDIAYSPADRMYMITGWRQQVSVSREHRLFFFGIDKDGNMMTRYKSIGVKGIPQEEDMVYDGANRCFAVTYIHRSSSQLETRGLASGIGLLTIDAALNVNVRKFYWNDLFVENQGVSISLVKEGGYVIGGTVIENTAALTHNPFLLKVDKAGWPTFFRRYNIRNNVTFGHHVTTSGPFNAGEQYVLVGEQKTDLRVIRTDVNGTVCGAVEEDVKVNEPEILQELFRYSPTTIGDEKEFTAQMEEIKPGERKCSELNPQAYRGAVTGISENDLAGPLVYPTAIPVSDAVFTVENNSGALSLQVSDITGKVVHTSNLDAGKNTVRLSSGALTEGVYFVTFQSGSGAMPGTSKLLLTR